MEQFEKVRSLGRGAQGTVILVRRKADKHKFCIKKIYIDDQSPEDQQEVMNEIRVLAKLAHPNIVAYYGSFVENEDLNVVMEYADGGTLSSHIQKAKVPFTEAAIMRLFTQLLLCLDYLHSKKILHRDLKTKNIFMTKKLQVKLGDFGLSKMMGSQTDFAQSAVGTPYYLSPELCEGKPYNHKSDVWAIGCVLYELVTFKHAFDATNLPALVMSIVQGKFEPVGSHYSRGIHELINAMLQKDPNNRPSIPDLLEHPLVMEYIEEAMQISEGSPEDFPSMRKDKPFFEGGRVETAVTQSKAGVARPTDQIMKEVQEEGEFARLVSQMRKTLHVQDRILGRIPYFNTFVAKDLVNFLCDHLGIRDRVEATRCAQDWMDASVFYHVNRGETFADGEGLYRFREDEVGSILNMKAKWSGPVRPALEIVADVQKLLASIIGEFTVGLSRQVDYTNLAVSEGFQEFQVATTEMQKLDLTTLSFNIKIAFFINLYNALVMHGFLVLGPPSTLHQRIFFYNHTCYNLGGYNYCLNDIEHGLLRGNKKPRNTYTRMFTPSDPRLKAAVLVWDPRIHFALVRGSRSCPVLRLYDHERLDAMLNDAATEFCSAHVEITSAPGEDSVDFSGWSIREMKAFLEEREVDPREFTEKAELAAACKRERLGMMAGGNGRMAEVLVTLPTLFEWYAEDFGGTDEAVLLWLKPYVQPFKAQALDTAIEQDNFILQYSAFDWSLNKYVTDTIQPPPSPSMSPSYR